MASRFLFWAIVISFALFLVSKNDEILMSFANKSVEGTDYITTSNYANPQLKYYYFIPSSLEHNTKNAYYPVIVMVPGLSGIGQDLAKPFVKNFAEKNGFIIIAPTFIGDLNNWESKTSYQYPDAWSGNALLKILETFSDNKKITISKLYMFGFSAGAQFSLRFTLSHPNIVQACASNGNGGLIIPSSRNNVKYFITVGNADEQVRKDNAANFMYAAKILGLSAAYKEYPEGHALSDEQINDGLEFFRLAKAQ